MVDQPRHVLGDPDAPVTIEEFGDLECPYCRATAPVLRALVETSAGRVRLVWRHFPLFEVHPHALAAALAAEAAGAHGQFWPMHDLLFAHQDRMSEGDLRGRALELGLDPDDVVGPRAQAYAGAVQADYAEGLRRGVEGTPSLFVNGVRYTGRRDLVSLQDSIDLA